MKRVAVVTGGTSGMGEAAVSELEKRGWQVAPMARSKAEFQGDVAADADCRRVAKAVLDAAPLVTGEIIHIDGGMHIASPR